MFNSRLIAKMKIISFLSFLLLLIYSCEYEPKEIFSSAVTKDSSPPTIHNITLDLEEDTIFVYFDHTFDFKFESSNQPVEWVRIVIDTVQESIIYSDSGSFSLHRQKLKEGLHTLRLEVFSSSGTGSISDQLGMEGFLFSKDWTISAEPIRNNRLASDIKNGFLKLKWDEMKSKSLKQFIISRQAATSSEITFEISKTNQTEYIDSVYIGEGADYTVYAELDSGSKYLWGYLRINPAPPAYVFKATTENKYFITWSDLKFSGSIGKMKIYTWYPSVILDSVLLPTDPYYILRDALFGDYKYYIIKILPKFKYKSCPQLNNEIEVKLTNWGIGYPSPAMDLFAPYGKNEIIYLKGKSLYRYSLITNEILQRKTFNISYTSSLSVSPGGKYMTFHTIPEGELYFCSANDFGIDVSEMQVSALINNYGSVVSLSDNGIGLIKSRSSEILVYDFLRKNILIKFKLGMGVGTFLISPTGDYVCLQSDSIHMYRFQNNELIHLWKTAFTNSVKYIGFSNTSPEQFILFDKLNIYFKNCENFSTVNQYPFSNKTVNNIDLFNNNILAFSEGHLYVYDLINGTLLKDIITNLKDYEMEYVHSFGNSILTNNGLRFFIN
jgi:hypothetical protein